MKKDDVKPNLFIEIADLMGKRTIISHKVLNSVRRIAKQSHVWFLQDEVFVIKKVQKRFTGFKRFRGVERQNLAMKFAKDFVIGLPEHEGETT